MDAEGASRVIAALIAKCPEWAAGLLAVAVSAFAGVQSVRGIVSAMKGLTGPTNQQVDVGIKKAVDESINGQLKKLVAYVERLDGKVERLDAKVDSNSESIAELRGTLRLNRR